ncbi:MAG: HIT family protein [Mycoplasmatales bacterium]
MKECIFCKIIAKEIPATVIYENEEIIAFLDVNPQSPGHTLIVPKTHYENILQKTDQVDLLKYSEIVRQKLSEIYNVTDFKLLINTGKKAGQEVFHLHLHFIPC